tara:strand:+ start:143 stop:400 length:258 start_codon:yes stop_codon:yes gene_type:complete
MSERVNISYIEAIYALHPNKSQFVMSAGHLEDLTEAQYNERYKEITSIVKDNLGENLSVLSSNPSDFKVSYAAAKAKYDELKATA